MSSHFLVLIVEGGKIERGKKLDLLIVWNYVKEKAFYLDTEVQRRAPTPYA